MTKEGNGGISDTDNETVHALKRLIDLQQEHVNIHNAMNKIIKELCDIEDKRILRCQTKPEKKE